MTDSEVPTGDVGGPSGGREAAWEMTQMIWGTMHVQAISVAASLGIADLVSSGAVSVVQLAERTGTNVAALRRLLRALSTLSIFTETEGETFGNTPRSETLRSDHPRSNRALAIMWGRPMFLRPWEDLRSAIVTGEAAFNRVFGEPFFEYLAHQREDAAIFNAAMSAYSAADLPSFVGAYDFSRFGRVVDVGGGRGALLRGVLTEHPRLTGVLYDLPEVVAGAGADWPADVAGRCEFIGGSFFDAAPAGADAYILRRIIHDWNDADALRILSSCRRAIAADGTLLVVDWVLAPPNVPDWGKFMDLHMLVTLGGRERTEEDFRALLREAGFVLTRVIPTAGPHSILESSPD